MLVLVSGGSGWWLWDGGLAVVLGWWLRVGFGWWLGVVLGINLGVVVWVRILVVAGWF